MEAHVKLTIYYPDKSICIQFHAVTLQYVRLKHPELVNIHALKKLTHINVTIHTYDYFRFWE